MPHERSTLQANDNASLESVSVHRRTHLRTHAVPLIVVGSIAFVLALGAFMVRRAEARVNKVALASQAQPVAVTRAAHSMYRASRNYEGMFSSWVEAGVGPQLISAYVDTVLVRPGAVVKRGEVLATLDCRNANATTQAAAMQARAIASQQKAIADEAARLQTLLKSGYVSTDEAETRDAQSAEREAQLAAQRAKLSQETLAVNDCVLRAPFDGEVASRLLDPGAFVRPGSKIVTVVDRSTVRLVADAPEADFGILNAGKPVRVRVYATKKEVIGNISRRAPSTDSTTRTIRFEVDVPTPQRDIPTNTTGEVYVDAGDPVPATVIPLAAASVREHIAQVFVLNDDVVHRRTFRVIGEIGGNLFLETALAPGAPVVVEGRELLEEGDRVDAVTYPGAVPEPQPAADTVTIGGHE